MEEYASSHLMDGLTKGHLSLSLAEPLRLRVRHVCGRVSLNAL